MRFKRSIVIFILFAAVLVTLGCSKAAKSTVLTPVKPALLSDPAPAPVPAAELPTARILEQTIIPTEEKGGTASGMRPADAEAGKDDATISIEDALGFYQDALKARERGDFDEAVRALDEAYGIILRIRVPSDSTLHQEKDDLRLLIAQRIQEISAARRNPVVDNHKSIPLTLNKWVQREIDSFCGPERKAFEEGYRRSGLYREWIVEELRKAGLPEELVWLPMVESWFKPLALSKARALGMWQFISSTGLRYNLKQDNFIDERRDPYKSTLAAIAYLGTLHSFFGDWTTALAAYNCGEGLVQRCINTQTNNYLDNFWDLFQRLPFETARFVPRFIAATLIAQDPAKFGMTLPEPYPPLKFETIRVHYPTKLSALSTSLGLEATALDFLNSELRHNSTPDRPYDLRVPLGTGEKAFLAINKLPKYVPPEYASHQVRTGETLSVIARRYGTSVQTIQRINNLRGTLIHPGQKLKIPGRG